MFLFDCFYFDRFEKVNVLFWPCDVYMYSRFMTRSLAALGGHFHG